MYNARLSRLNNLQHSLYGNNNIRNRFQKPTQMFLLKPTLIYERKKRAIKLSSILNQPTLRKQQCLAQILLPSSSSLQQ